MRVMISICPRKTIQTLLVVIVCLTIASVIGQIIEYSVGYSPLSSVETFVRLFNVEQEENVPTWYASSTLLLCSILLAAIAVAKKQTGDRYVVHWITLSITFLLLSVDETATIRKVVPLRSVLYASGIAHGFFYRPWVIPAAAFVLIFVLAYLRFLIDLPVRTRRLFLLAGTVFVAGALGMEAVSGRYADLYGVQTLTYEMLATVEELFEMMGVAIFIYALLSYLSVHVEEVCVHIGEGKSGSARCG